MSTIRFILPLALILALVSSPGCEKKTIAGGSSASLLNPSDSTAFLPAGDTAAWTVKTIKLTLEVNKCEETIDQIEKRAAEIGGIISVSRLDSPEDSERTANVHVRVPAALVDSLLNHVRRYSRRVESEGIWQTDARIRANGLDTRIAMLDKADDEFGSLLRSARSTSEMLELRKAILENQMNKTVLENERASLLAQLAFPEVTLHLREKNMIDDPARPGFWKKVRRAFEQGGNQIGDVIGWIIRVSIAAIPVIILGRVPLGRRHPVVRFPAAPRHNTARPA